jgi:putative ubiquitin-RnfH superfamily antitoxin RatB of RatAB toxin-antitoxin module
VSGARKRCQVAYAGLRRQRIVTVELPSEATVGDAIAAARRVAADEEVAWESAPVGIFGAPRTRADVPLDGDRIELYRPLRADPRERRRAAARIKK